MQGGESREEKSSEPPQTYTWVWKTINVGLSASGIWGSLLLSGVHPTSLPYFCKAQADFFQFPREAAEELEVSGGGSSSMKRFLKASKRRGTFPRFQPCTCTEFPPQLPTLRQHKGGVPGSPALRGNPRAEGRAEPPCFRCRVSLRDPLCESQSSKEKKKKKKKENRKPQIFLF